MTAENDKRRIAAVHQDEIFVMAAVCRVPAQPTKMTRVVGGVGIRGGSEQ
jgi:hypothetical protein